MTKENVFFYDGRSISGRRDGCAIGCKTVSKNIDNFKSIRAATGHIPKDFQAICTCTRGVCEKCMTSVRIIVQ